MLSMLAIASSRCGPPRVRADGSLKLAPSAPPAAGTGDGVAGAFEGVFDEGAGAAGAAGVDTAAGAGVDGIFEVDAGAAGADLGFQTINSGRIRTNHDAELPSTSYRL